MEATHQSQSTSSPDPSPDPRTLHPATVSGAALRDLARNATLDAIEDAGVTPDAEDLSRYFAVAELELAFCVRRLVPAITEAAIRDASRRALEAATEGSGE